MKRFIFNLAAFMLALHAAASVQGGLIDFTGGIVTQFAPDVGGTTSNTTLFDNVDFYVEDGVRFDFIGPPGDRFSYNVGNYYGVANDVIHGHWAAGPFGDMQSIRVEKVDGTPFDLNYFKITSNTSAGGGAASGSEEVYINALADGTNISYTQLLPPDDWGFGGSNSEILTGPEFDNIRAFTFTWGANAVGFGLDEFFIDIPPPNSGTVPEPGAMAVWAVMGVAGLAVPIRRRRSKKG